MRILFLFLIAACNYKHFPPSKLCIEGHEYGQIPFGPVVTLYDSEGKPKKCQE